ncbi:MAG: ATP-binding protein [Pseudomonadota bacterium]
MVKNLPAVRTENTEGTLAVSGHNGRIPGVRFYFAVAGDRPAEAVSKHRWPVSPDAESPQEGADAGRDTIERFSRGVAQHVNDLLMAVLGQSALCRLDAPDNLPLEAVLKKIEDMVQYGAHLTFHLLGLCGRGVFADPPYVAKTSSDSRPVGIIGYARERFRSFPFYHLSAALSRRPLQKDAVHTACRQLSLEYLIVFDHLLAATEQIQDVSVRRRAASMRRLVLKGRRLMAEIAAFAGGDPRRRRGKDVTKADTVTRILRSVLRNISSHQPALKVTMSLGIAVPALQMLPGDFCHVMAAVVKNAAEAMPCGGELTLIATARGGDTPVACTHTAAALEIAVCDTGRGIPDHAGRRIFDPFYTSKEGTRRFGLGLSGSLGRLRQVGGSIAVASAPGEGTVALIRIPVAVARRQPIGIQNGQQRVCTQTPVHCGC